MAFIMVLADGATYTEFDDCMCVEVPDHLLDNEDRVQEFITIAREGPHAVLRFIVLDGHPTVVNEGG